MSDALFIGIMFALPAGILFYFVLVDPDQPWADMRFLCAATLLFIVPLFGYPEAAGTAVLFFGAGLVLTGSFRRWLHQQETQPPPGTQPEPEPEPEPEPPTDQHRPGPPDTPSGETGPQPYPPTIDEHGRPIIFEDQ